jgi:murein DD-endopeptidase MepM/ murein hydrolase activator NlpD
MRTHPITGVFKLHTGTDYGYGDGKAYAARAGKVAAVTYDRAYGNMITISHGDGVQTRYAHLASVVVGDGEPVSAGQVVGRIGSTGYATGPHLHFEVLKNGQLVDPAGWL